MKRLIREPFLHFLVAGSILFGLLSWFAVEDEVEPGTDSHLIIVEREALLAFVQSRTKIVTEVASIRAFDALAPEVHREWVDRYVREEILVREARALGLDREDELIRRRLVQKIEFLTLGILEEGLQIDDEELEDLYREHGEDYRVPAMLTFTHVFVREGPNSRRRAEVLLAMLNENQVSFADALDQGDRFLYNRNYVDRTIDEVRSHFGAEITAALEAATPDASRWTGPHQSAYGWHLILLTRRTESQRPRLAEIAGLLREDALREKREAALESAIEAIRSRYRVEMSPASE